MPHDGSQYEDRYLGEQRRRLSDEGNWHPATPGEVFGVAWPVLVLVVILGLALGYGVPWDLLPWN